MGLKTEVIQICSMCQEDFIRPRRLLDSLGTNVMRELICSDCIKELDDDRRNESKQSVHKKNAKTSRTK